MQRLQRAVGQRPRQLQPHGVGADVDGGEHGCRRTWSGHGRVRPACQQCGVRRASDRDLAATRLLARDRHQSGTPPDARHRERTCLEPVEIDRPPAVHQPRAVLAGVQRARARRGARRRAAAVRAAQVPRHRLVEPRRVLHGPRRRPQAAARSAASPRPPADGMLAGRAARAISERVHAHGRRAVPRLAARSCCPLLARARHRACSRRDALHAPSSGPPRATHFTLSGLPGADAAGGRPGPPVPAPAQQVAQPRGDAAPARARRRTRRAHGAARSRWCRCRRCWPPGAAARRRAGQRLRCCSRTLIAAHVGDLFPGFTVRADRRASASPATGTCYVDEEESEDLLVDDPGGAAPARPRRRGAPGARRTAPRAELETLLADALELDAARRLPRRAARCSSSDLTALADARPAPRAARRAAGAGAAAALARRRLDLRGDRAARHPAAPPVRVVRPGGALHRGGGRRPERAGHQADALPHQRRLPDRARALRARPRTASR